MSAVIAVLSIVAYLVGFALTWRRQVRTYLRNTLAEQIAEAEKLAAQLHYAGDQVRAEAQTLPDHERSAAAAHATFLAFFWPAWWLIYPFIRLAKHVVDGAAGEAERGQRELKRLREIAKQEGWEL